MSSLTFFLDRIQHLCESMGTLKFSSPGIFTNAIINKPVITDLLKDASVHEQALYKINRSSVPHRPVSGVKRSYESDAPIAHGPNLERIDGKSFYIDDSFNDYVSDQTADEHRTKRTAVRVPRIRKEARPANQPEQQDQTAETDPFLSPKKDAPAPPNYQLIPESLLNSDRVDEICSHIVNLVEMYPSLKNDGDLLKTINRYQQEYAETCYDIEKLEEVLRKQKKQLNHSSGSDLSSPVRSPEKEDLDALIAKEELLLKDLEDKLKRRERDQELPGL